MCAAIKEQPLQAWQAGNVASYPNHRLKRKATDKQREGRMLRSLLKSPLFDAEDRFIKLASRLAHGSLEIKLGDGGWHHVDSGNPGISAAIHIIKPASVIHRYMTGGAVGFAESYIEGEWDTPDLARLLQLLDSNEDAWSDNYAGSWLSRQMRRIYHWRRDNTKEGSKRNIYAHYDLGNRFFETWLDPSMTYSSALFEDPSEPLDTAQARKYRRLAEALQIDHGDRVLEIGCGWGGFAEIAAKEFGARMTCVTISREQHAYAAERIQREGLNEQVEIRLQDYRDIKDPFDRIASIEMFEAVGERYWPVYFGKLKESLAPAGRAGLQIITIADRHFETYRKNADFIQRYIFPGGMLPSPKALDAQFDQAGLRKADELAFGLDYARTLAIWHDRFEATWGNIRELGFDERFRRIWRYYLAYCEAGFRTGSIDVRQIVVKPG
jgi:cyclopropane-fatty-acyl-phospholipid synthase